MRQVEGQLIREQHGDGDAGDGDPGGGRPAGHGGERMADPRRAGEGHRADEQRDGLRAADDARAGYCHAPVPQYFAPQYLAPQYFASHPASAAEPAPK